MNPTRITITADDVRGLFQRFPGWGRRRSGGSNWEDWEYLPTKNSACIPITPGVELMADYQSCLWGTVRDAGFAMGIGTDIYVHLGMMLQERSVGCPDYRPRPEMSPEAREARQ